MQAERDNGVKIISSLTRTDIREGITEGLIGTAEVGVAMDSYHEKYGIHG